MADWSTLLNQFHWLRPLWLLLIPVAVLLTLWLLRHPQHGSHWKKIIDPALLPYLLQQGAGARQRWPVVLLGLALVLTSLALAGPAWEKLPQPIHKREDATVILLDLSPSMEAQDLQPSRLVRARLKLTDLLKQRREGVTALVVYAGEAHTVTPLTDDTATIINLLPALSPDVMPLRGSNTEMAVERGLQLLLDAGHTEGELLLVTDGVATDALDSVRRLLPSSVRLSILGVGTTEGAPIPLANGGFAKNHLGNMVLAKLNSTDLAELAVSSGGRFTPLTPDDRDLQLLSRKPTPLQSETRQLQREFDTWLDRGPWLLLPLLPLMLLAFRRGWLLALFPLMLFPGEPAQAGVWQDLWQTPDQQASELLQAGDNAAAAEKFERPDWKATAQYRAGNYAEAAKLLEQDHSAGGHYNRGNALAKSGDLPGALEAYDQALQLNPALEDAAANRQQVEALLQQQQQQQQQNQNSQGQQNDPQQNQQQSGDSSQNQQGQESQDGQQQSSQQSSSGQSSSGEQGDSRQQGEAGDEQQRQANSPGDAEEKSDGRKPESQAQEAGQQTEDNGEQQNASQAAGQPQDKQNTGDESPQQGVEGMASEDDGLSDEERQTMEQMLRRIPDDPSGLLRNKFEYQYRQRRQAYQQGTWEPPENNAAQRW
ncbi:VWA domain-containing protein [Pseudomaricurvus sp. HS19]|uniref:vWA domain-containing protein n=1 Tax=Pseudomaricurvus sp. HS19 TaxID=2692626 RepID=UPI00136A7385|nr:VWA domain-containing protein [Pseudomaricurvus sp. HS19]MYM61850.1 VWA domain-containing protein [Pseudomaricurvus sp. HS19]